jgi:hypothetical protein
MSEVAYEQEQQENLSGADLAECYYANEARKRIEKQYLVLNRFSLIKREIEKELKLLEALKNVKQQ